MNEPKTTENDMEPKMAKNMRARRKTEYRNALMWAFDRLSVDGGMNGPEQRHTMEEIGKVLAGHPTPASRYTPNEWDDSANLRPDAHSTTGT